MRLDWQMFGALITGFSGMSAFAVFVINAVIEKRLSAFLKDLNGMYLRTALAQERFDSLERSVTERFTDIDRRITQRLTEIDRRIGELHNYTHEWRHELGNELMKIRGIK